MAQATFYRCAKCGNIVALVKKGTCIPQCCGEQMEVLVAGSVDAAVEKHVPSVTRADGKIFVQVGSVEHPMLDVHYIEWIALATESDLNMHFLTPEDKPVAVFADDGASDATVYAYCNLHGLWKAEA